MVSTSTVDAARLYAVEMHGAQKYGVHPYSYHLDAVASLARPYGELAQVIAYLHDVVEDTEATQSDVEARFGPLVGACVGLLTDEPGANRKERKARTYAKMAKVHGPEQLALIVKAADRLANVRACVADRHASLLNVYRDEQPTFKAAAFRDGLCDDLWGEIERLFDQNGAGLQAQD